MRIAQALLTAIAAAPALLRAQTIPAPKLLAEVPIFADAKRVQTDTSDAGAEGPMHVLAAARHLKTRAQEIVAYEVPAHPEAVLEFYAHRLGARLPKDFDELDFTRQKPGTSSDVFFLPIEHHVDEKGRATLASRPKYEGEWIAVVVFMWGGARRERRRHDFRSRSCRQRRCP